MAGSGANSRPVSGEDELGALDFLNKASSPPEEAFLFLAYFQGKRSGFIPGSTQDETLTDGGYFGKTAWL